MDCRIKSGNDTMSHCLTLGPRHCEERTRRSNPDSRASLLDCFADARNDVQTNPFSRHVHVPEPCRPRSQLTRPLQIKGGEAPKGACQPLTAHAQTSARELARLICCAAARHCRRRARLPALRPRLSQGLPPLLSSRPCFLRLGIKRALPALSCPSPVTAPHASALVPKG